LTFMTETGVAVMTCCSVTIARTAGTAVSGRVKQYSGVLPVYLQIVCFPPQYRNPFALPSAMPRQAQPDAHFCGAMVVVVGVILR